MVDFDNIPKKSCYNCYWFSPDSPLQCGLVSVKCSSSPESGTGSKPLFTNLTDGLKLLEQKNRIERSG